MDTSRKIDSPIASSAACYGDARNRIAPRDPVNAAFGDECIPEAGNMRCHLSEGILW